MGVPQAFSTRVVPTLVLCAAAVVMMMQGEHVSGQTPQAPPEGTVRIMPAISTALLQDGPFDVYVVLDNFRHLGTIAYDDNQDGIPDRGVPSDGMAAFEFTLQFDPTVIALDGAEPGPGLGATGRNFQCLAPRRDAPDKFTFGCISLEEQPAGTQGSLTLATVTVRPLARGSSPLLLQAGIAGPLGDDAPVGDVGAVVRATGQTSKVATATLGPGVTPNSSRSPVATNATLPAAGTVTPTSSGTPPAAPRTTTPTRVVAGSDGDGNTEAGNNWRPSAVLWSLLGVGGVVAMGTLGLAAALLRRSKRWGA